jgi:hypothetical protein
MRSSAVWEERVVRGTLCDHDDEIGW